MPKYWIQFICFFFLCNVGAVANAAEFDTVGIRVGGSASYMRLGGYGRSETIGGSTVGPFVSIKLSEHLAVLPSAVYSRRGGDYNEQESMLFGGLAEVDHLRIRRDYIELPVLFRVSLVSTSGFAPYILAGLSWGWVIDSEVTEDGVAYPDHSGRTDQAMHLGVGALGLVGGKPISLDFVYRRALAGLGTNEASGSFRADAIDISVGLGLW